MAKLNLPEYGPWRPGFKRIVAFWNDRYLPDDEVVKFSRLSEVQSLVNSLNGLRPWAGQPGSFITVKVDEVILDPNYTTIAFQESTEDRHAYMLHGTFILEDTNRTRGEFAMNVGTILAKKISTFGHWEISENGDVFWVR